MSETDGIVTLANVTLADLGRAKQVVVDQEKTTILGGPDARPTSRRAPERFDALYEGTGSTLERTAAR